MITIITYNKIKSFLHKNPLSQAQHSICTADSFMRKEDQMISLQGLSVWDIEEENEINKMLDKYLFR